ncbi:MAG: hypothetical protein ABWY54_08640 [Glaciihabitans sp.]
MNDSLPQPAAIHLDGGPRDGERILVDDELPESIADEAGQYLPANPGHSIADDALVYVYEFHARSDAPS